MIEQFIINHSDIHTDKDIFEYCSNNGVNNGETLVNKMFKYEITT